MRFSKDFCDVCVTVEIVPSVNVKSHCSAGDNRSEKLIKVTITMDNSRGHRNLEAFEISVKNSVGPCAEVFPMCINKMARDLPADTRPYSTPSTV